VLGDNSQEFPCQYSIVVIVSQMGGNLLADISQPQLLLDGSLLGFPARAAGRAGRRVAMVEGL
jgi:hypothetical protein